MMAAIGQRGTVGVVTAQPTSPTSAAATVAGGRPTKLFIGGVSRHTTTKQLRDHFSQHGRVLDCVAMRQPDGRSRGFGYVTLDSLAAAERCLMEPQVIDGRVVDMKLAVPEGSATDAKFSGFNAALDFPTAGGGSPHGLPPYGGVAEWSDAFHAHLGPLACAGGVCGSPMAGSPWWAGHYTSLGARAPLPLDCLDLLVREDSEGGCLHSQPQLDMLSMLSTSPTACVAGSKITSTAVPGVSVAPSTPSSQTMSASAPCFVPTEMKSNIAKVPTRTPLGELTNVAANIVNGSSKNTIMEPKKPPGLSFLSFGPVAAVPPSGLINTPAREVRVATPLAIAVDPELEEEVNSELGSDDQENNESAASPSCDSEDDEDSAPDEAKGESVAKTTQEGLPSLGSALHAAGECRRCNFFTKGRCQNGTECSFCHMSHEKRKPTRQEKRERKAMWTEQQEQQQQLESQPVLQHSVQQDVCQDTQQGAQQQFQQDFQHEHHLADEELCQATSSFLGLPPVLASTLSTSGGVSLLTTPAAGDLTSSGPPGLSAPGACFGLLGASLAGYGGGFRTFDGVVALSQWEQAEVEDPPACCLPPVLATTPPNLAYPMASASTMSYPATPTSVLSTTPTGALASGVLASVKAAVVVSPTSMQLHGRCWPRDEMLRIRGAMEAAGTVDAASEKGSNGRLTSRYVH